MKNPPEKMIVGQWFNGQHHDIWHYTEVPDGMRRASLRDLWPGRQFLYQVQLGPDKGEYYTGFYAGNNIEPIRDYIRRGVPVYVKD